MRSMYESFFKFSVVIILLISLRCSTTQKLYKIQDVRGSHEMVSDQVWLSHEHILVDFIGAEKIQPETWNHEDIMKETLPYLKALKKFNVHYFVDATPNYLGRDVRLLEKLAKRSDLTIITNTGLYGARNNKFIPKYAIESSAEELADMWISEYQNGIDGTSIKPGFIKIGIDNAETLSEIHQKLVEAAGRTHLETGLTIASHTGKAAGLWPQLEILKNMGVSPKAFIWIHAQAEGKFENYLKAAKEGCWISFDGVGKKMEKYIEAILYAKKHGFLDQVLISHDAGWYDPQNDVQDIKPYTPIFEKLYPELKSRGFTDEEFNLLVSVNPSKAFGIEVRKYDFRKQ